MKGANANDVLKAIFARHQGEEWVRFAEVADGTGMNASRRADAVCMNIWPSKGYAIHGFEIKVTRADFLHEMKDITKAEAVGQYCDFWWLAAAQGVAKVDELPASWGLMELHSNGLKIKKQAPKRENPADISRRFMASMLRKSRDSDKAHIAAQVAIESEKLRQRLEREHELNKPARDSRAEENSAWIAQFEATLGCRFSTYPKPEDMVKRMKMAEVLNFGSITHLANQCKRIIELADEMKDPPSDPDLLV